MTDTAAEPEGPRAGRYFRTILLLILLLAGALRAPALLRGVDSGEPSLQWRETDVTAVARNFEREGMNILYPRIDWRGTGPGFVEMEFPIVSWCIALGREVFGPHEQIGRVFSFLVSMATLLVFALLARLLIGSLAALAGAAFLAVNPLFVQVSTAILPEPLMLFASVLCVYCFWRWLQEPSSGRWSVGASVAGGLAILTKVPAIHLGLLLLPLLIWQRGWRSLRSARPWLMAVVMVGPSVAWYLHANGFWLDYGNSIGISNESHWTGLDALTQPHLLVGMLRSEVVQVWRGGGILIGIFGALMSWRQRGTRVALLWMLAALMYLAAVSRTTSQWWAFYYHVVALPPAALLFGRGVAAAFDLRPGWRTPAWVTAGVATLTLGAGLAWALAGVGARFVVAGACGTIVGAAWTALEHRRDHVAPPPEYTLWGGYARRTDCAGLIGAAALTAMWTVVGLQAVLPRPAPNPLAACSRQFSELVPPAAVLLSSSWSCYDPEGKPQASNMPFFFYWMDRKGFNICRQQQSVEAVEAYAARGARYFAIDPDSRAIDEAFDVSLTARFPLVAECAGSRLFDLRGSSDR